MKRGELGVEYLDDLSFADQVVALGIGKNLQDPWGARGRKVAELGVEGDAGEALVFHRRTDLSFDERFGEHGYEVAEQDCLDAVWVLDEHRGNGQWTLQHVVTAFEVRLVVVEVKHLGEPQTSGSSPTLAG